METFAFIVTDLIWGALTLIGVAIIIFAIIHFIKKRKIGVLVGSILCALLISAVPAYCLCLTTSKYLSTPNPTNEEEVCVNGENYIQYQDTEHFCHAEDPNSMSFTSLRPINGEASQDDTCIICGEKFIRHNTHREQRYFERMEEMSFMPNF